MSDASGVVLIVGLLVALFLLWLGREITCWYFKINELLDMLTKTNKLLDTIAKNTSAPMVADLDELPLSAPKPIAPVARTAPRRNLFGR